MTEQIYIFGNPKEPEFPTCREHADYFEIWGKPDLEHPEPRGLCKLLPYYEGLKTLERRYGQRELMQRTQVFVAYARKWLLGDLYALQRFCLSHGDRWHDDHGKRWLDLPWLFDKVRELDRRERRGALHRTWIYWARGHWKTTEMQALCIRLILENQNVRIMYYSRTHPMAQKRARGIRKELEDNRLIHLLWPEIVWGPDPLEGDATVWGDESFTVQRKGRAGEAMSEATLGASGIIQGLKTGDHVEVNVFDDVEDDDNAHTETMVSKTVRNVRAARKITDASSALLRQDWYVGTQYDRHGPYAKLKAEGAIRTVWVESAVDWNKPNLSYDKPTRENKKALDIGGHEPVLLTPEALQDIRGKGEESWRDFCLQFLCKLDLAETRPLDHGRPQQFRTPPHKVARVASTYILGDPGGFAGPSSDLRKISDSVVLALALCSDGYMRLIDTEIGIMSGPTRVKTAFNMAHKWKSYGHLVEVRLEEGGTGNDCGFLAEMQIKRDFIFRIVRVTRGGGYGQLNKVERIYKLVEPILDKLCLPRDMKRWRDRVTSKSAINVEHWMRQVLEEYPNVENANILDALALISEPPDKKVTVFRGDKILEEQLGVLQWPSTHRKFRRGDHGPTVGQTLKPGSQHIAAAFGVSAIPERTFRRSA